MPQQPTLQAYKIKKGDTLAAIAKAFGHQDWKSIWLAGENRTLVSKRRVPEAIQAGDVLSVPPNPAQMRERAGRLKASLASLKDEEDRTRRRIRLLTNLLDDEQEMTEQTVKELSATLRGMKGTARNVDAAAELVALGTSMFKVFSIAGKATRASAKELLQLDKEAQKAGEEFLRDKADDLLLKMGAKMKENANYGIAFIGTALDVVERENSPSYWANAWVQYRGNGKSWSEAVASEVGDDIEARIKGIKAAAARRRSSTLEHRSRLQKHLEDCQQATQRCTVLVNQLR